MQLYPPSCYIDKGYDLDGPFDSVHIIIGLWIKIIYLNAFPIFVILYTREQMIAFFRHSFMFLAKALENNKTHPRFHSAVIKVRDNSFESAINSGMIKNSMIP